MTDKEILEGNKLIAEFIGWTYVKVKSKKIDWWIPYRNDKMAPNIINHPYLQITYSNSRILALCFHESWDWLMPVLEKIEQLKNMNVYTGKTKLGEFHIEITHEKGLLDKCIFVKDKTLTKLESYYKAIVEFIQWYNKHKYEFFN